MTSRRLQAGLTADMNNSTERCQCVRDSCTNERGLILCCKDPGTAQPLLYSVDDPHRRSVAYLAWRQKRQWCGPMIDGTIWPQARCYV